MKEFKVFKNVLDMLMDIWVNMKKKIKELMDKYDILKS
jgi:hypothetical protein